MKGSNIFLHNFLSHAIVDSKILVRFRFWYHDDEYQSLMIWSNWTFWLLPWEAQFLILLCIVKVYKSALIDGDQKLVKRLGTKWFIEMLSEWGLGNTIKHQLFVVTQPMWGNVLMDIFCSSTSSTKTIKFKSMLQQA